MDEGNSRGTETSMKHMHFSSATKTIQCHMAKSPSFPQLSLSSTFEVKQPGNYDHACIHLKHSQHSPDRPEGPRHFRSAHTAHPGTMR